jgi:hypothetical protein
VSSSDTGWRQRELELAARRRSRRTGRLRDLQSGRCRVCACTDDDCSQCVEATGEPCSWVDEARTLCSRCGGGP